MDKEKSWPNVDMDFLREFTKLHNEVAFNRKNQGEFNKFVIDNKEKLNNPDYLQVFIENCEITDKFFKENFETCKLFYDFMISNPEWKNLGYGLRTFMRLEAFEYLFEKIIDGMEENNNVK